MQPHNALFFYALQCISLIIPLSLRKLGICMFHQVLNLTNQYFIKENQGAVSQSKCP